MRVIKKYNLFLESHKHNEATVSPSAQNWYLGRDDFDVRYGNGVIFSVMRYNRQLTDAEVLQNYNATKTRFI